MICSPRNLCEGKPCIHYSHRLLCILLPVHRGAKWNGMSIRADDAIFIKEDLEMLITLLAHGKNVYRKLGLRGYVLEMNALQSESRGRWEDFAYRKFTAKNICGIWLT